MDASRDLTVGIVLKRKYEELGCSGGAALFYWVAQIMSIPRQIREPEAMDGLLVSRFNGNIKFRKEQI